MRSILLILLCCFSLVSKAQTKNGSIKSSFGFENKENSEELPQNWEKLIAGDYYIAADSVVKHTGKYSIRVTAGENPVQKRSFAGVSYKMPANITGKTIELRGFLKVENVEGFAGLLLKIEGRGGILAFENMQFAKNKIEGTRDWKNYSIKLPYPEEAKFISIGALMSRKGTLWVDDLELFIDGKPISEAVPKTLTKAELDKEFDKGSKLDLKSINNSQLQDLELLAKIWGFLKYHHPSILKGEYNWDYELFRITPKVLSAGTKEDRDNVLFEWVSKLGGYEKGKLSLTDTSQIKMMPDFKWLNRDSLGRQLYNKLTEIKTCKRPENGYYFKIHDYVPIAYIKNESSYSDFNYPDDGYRMLSLFRYWNIVHYFFPYKYLIGRDWNEILKEFLPAFIGASSELEYKKSVTALIANIHDSHVIVFDNNGKLNAALGSKHPAFQIDFVEKQAVVTNYLDSALGLAAGLQKGDIIESINGTKVNDIVTAKLPFVSASNYPTQLARIAPVLLRTNDSVLSVTYLRDRNRYNKAIKCYPIQRFDLHKKYSYRDTCFKILKPGVAYLNAGSIKVSYLPAIMKEVLNTKAFIIDLRYYPKESIVSSLGEYLFEKPTDFVKFSFLNEDIPGLFSFGKIQKVGKRERGFYKGKVIVLVNENTISNGEFTAMAFRKAPNSIIIGSQTAGADGNVIPNFSLPGGITTRFTGLGVYYPDGKETQRIGIVPDILISPTIQGIKEGRDEVLEKAIEESIR